MGEISGSFLRTRRDRTDPSSIGLDPAGSGRRVPGLRCDELVRLAGVSVSYYTHIEQNQVGTAPGQVLGALAPVMHPDIVERVHLYNLTGAPTSSPMSRELPEVSHPKVLVFFESLNEAIPVMVLGYRGSILAWSHSGYKLLLGYLPFGAPPEAHRRPSIPYLLFMGPASRDLYRNWEDLARVYVAYLRLTSGRHPCDVRSAELVGKPLAKSARFAGLWVEEDVADRMVGNMLFAYPGLGHINIDYQVWQQSESPDHCLEVYTPNDRSFWEVLDLLRSRRFPPRTVGTCE